MFDSTPITTVIIPSIGRETITRALASLINQKNPCWNAIVGFDAISEEVKSKLLLFSDPRITYIFIGDKVGGGLNHGGKVRNFLMKEASTEWVSFLDDDDTFRPDYIDRLIEEKERHASAQVIMFRMSYDPNDQFVLPPLGMNKPVICRVGISFSVKKDFLEKNNLKFENDGAEDYKLLKAIDDLAAPIIFSNYITYNIRF